MGFRGLGCNQSVATARTASFLPHPVRLSALSGSLLGVIKHGFRLSPLSADFQHSSRHTATVFSVLLAFSRRQRKGKK